MTSRRRRSFDTVANARHPDIPSRSLVWILDSALGVRHPFFRCCRVPIRLDKEDAPYSPGPIVPRTPSVTGYLAPEISQAGSSAVQKMATRSGLSHDTRRHMVLRFQVNPRRDNTPHIGHTAAISSRPGPPPRTKIQPASRSVEERLPVRTAFDSLEKMNLETQKRNCTASQPAPVFFWDPRIPNTPFLS